MGFLADWRRMNVALTRATRGVVVVGHRRTLANDPAWGSWIDYCDRAGASRRAVEELLR